MPGYGRNYKQKKKKTLPQRYPTVFRDDRVVQGTPKQAVNKTNKSNFGPEQQVNRKSKSDSKPFGDDTQYMYFRKRKRNKA